MENGKLFSQNQILEGVPICTTTSDDENTACETVRRTLILTSL